MHKSVEQDTKMTALGAEDMKSLCAYHPGVS